MSFKDWLRFWALSIVWGTSFLWIKIALAEISPAMLASWRTWFGGLGLLVVLLLVPAARLPWPRLRQVLPTFALIGLLNVTLPFLLISWAEQYIESGLAAILNGTVPLFSLLIAPYFIPAEKMTFARLAGLLVGFFGILILSLPQVSQGFNQNLLAQIAMLLAALSYAVATIYTRLKAHGLPPQMQAFLQVFMGWLLLTLFTLGFDRPLVLPALPLTWFALLWLGLLGSCLAYLLYFSLLGSVGPTRTVLVTYVLPLVGVALGVLFLNERPTWQSLAGGLLIISGVWLVNSGLKLPFARKPA